MPFTIKIVRVAQKYQPSIKKYSKILKQIAKNNEITKRKDIR
jgi:hypothetical protein